MRSLSSSPASCRLFTEEDIGSHHVWIAVAVSGCGAFQELARDQMGITATYLQLRRVSERHLHIDLLPDVRAGRSLGRSGDGRAARAVERVGRAGEPPRVVTASELQSGRRPDLEAGAQVLN